MAPFSTPLPDVTRGPVQKDKKTKHQQKQHSTDEFKPRNCIVCFLILLTWIKPPTQALKKLFVNIVVDGLINFLMRML
jgi:hypothetical protein